MSFAGFWGFARDREAKLGYRIVPTILRDNRDYCRAVNSRWSSRGIGQTLVARIDKNANHLDFDSAILIGPLPQPHAEAK